MLKEHEKTADLARKHGISEATFYNANAKYGCMDVSEARWLKALGSTGLDPAIHLPGIFPVAS